MALLASMWILPGLLGPPLGAIIAETVGWRWAFLAPPGHPPGHRPRDAGAPRRR